LGGRATLQAGKGSKKKDQGKEPNWTPRSSQKRLSGTGLGGDLSRNDCPRGRGEKRSQKTESVKKTKRTPSEMGKFRQSRPLMSQFKVRKNSRNTQNKGPREVKDGGKLGSSVPSTSRRPIACVQWTQTEGHPKKPLNGLMGGAKKVGCSCLKKNSSGAFGETPGDRKLNCGRPEGRQKQRAVRLPWKCATAVKPTRSTKNSKESFQSKAGMKTPPDQVDRGKDSKKIGKKKKQRGKEEKLDVSMIKMGHLCKNNGAWAGRCGGWVGGRRGTEQTKGAPRGDLGFR